MYVRVSTTRIDRNVVNIARLHSIDTGPDKFKIDVNR